MATLPQHQFAQPLNELIDSNLSLYIGKVVASLPEKEAAILNMRFGLQNHHEMTLQAIADQLHVTRERVRQIQNDALKKLKQQFGYDLLPFLEPNQG
jgi:RNA polymerase primary sigma factor